MLVKRAFTHIAKTEIQKSLEHEKFGFSKILARLGKLTEVDWPRIPHFE